MHEVTDQSGMNIDPNILISVQSNFISQARIKEVQLEAAVQQLMGQLNQANKDIEKMKARLHELEGDEVVEVAEEGAP